MNNNAYYEPYVLRDNSKTVLDFDTEGKCLTYIKSKESVFYKCSLCGRDTSKSVKHMRRSKQEISLDNLNLCGFCLGKETNLEKYGVDNPAKSEEIKKKIVLNKNPEDEKKKREKTLLEKYGVTNPSSLEYVKEKKRKTYLKRYGVDSPLKSKEIHDKLKETNLEKYGVENVSQVDFVKEKKRRLKINKTISSLRVKLKKEGILILSSNKEFKGLRDSYKNENYLYTFKCLKCGNIFVDNVHSRVPRCLSCNPVQKSTLEKEILDFISGLGLEVLSGDRKIISPLELDIVIPEKMVAIEFNGLYWHSFQSGKDENYHLSKSISAKENGYSLIHVFEDEWQNKKEIVKSIIKNRLGLFDKRIFARKCHIKEIDSDTAKSFFDKNHLQGNSTASLNIGLFNDGDLVSCMSFSKPRYNKNYEWEIIRFSNRLNTLVVGGFSKLLKYFTKNYNGDIITYSDRRLFDGSVYRNNGFKELKPSKPNYYYFKGSSERMSRVKFQKHKLENLLEDFDENLTEKENMENNGFRWIYDCGNWVFELRRNNGL